MNLKTNNLINYNFFFIFYRSEIKQALVKTLECFPLILPEIFIKLFPAVFRSSSSSTPINRISEM